MDKKTENKPENKTAGNKRVLIALGANLDLLGLREPEQYGQKNIEDLKGEIKKLQSKVSLADAIELEFYQSNQESSFIDKVCQPRDLVILNPGAWTHTSIALRDRLAAARTFFYEVHFSQVYARENFRHYSYTAPLAQCVIAGLGINGVLLAFEHYIKENHV